MTVLELKKEIDDYIEAGGDKYANVLIDDDNYPAPRMVLEVAYREYDEATGGLVIK